MRFGIVRLGHSGIRPRWSGACVMMLALHLGALASAAVPAAPSNLVVSSTILTTGTNWWILTWDDNSANENGFRIEYSTTGPTSGFLTLANMAVNSTSMSAEWGTWAVGAKIYFRVKAYNSSGASNPSNVYLFTQPASTFDAPGPVTATAMSEDMVRLTWQDNSTTEEVFYIEYRQVPDGSFTQLGSVWFYMTNVTISGYFIPGGDYELRVRAAKGDPIQYTAYSAAASVHMPFNAPTGLSGIALREDAVALQWQDNSTQEHGYAVEARIQGEPDWYHLFFTAANATNSGTIGCDPGTTNEFRVRAAYQEVSGGPITYSDPSGIAIVATPFYAPSNLQAAAVSDGVVSLSWEDNSQVEDGYQALMRVAGDVQWQSWDGTSSNATSLTTGDLPAGTDLEFAVRAYHLGVSDVVYSAISPVASVATRDGFLGRDYEPIIWGVPFTYQVRTSTHTSLASLVVGTLPDGLSYNPTTAVISGTPTVSGVYQVPMEATFADGWTNSRTMTLRIVRPVAPPVSDAAIAGQAVPVGGNVRVPLSDKFSDPDTETAVRMSTSKGDIDIILYPSATPQTVSNFLGYVDRGDYEGVCVHRSLPGFVVQAGGYEATAEPNYFTHIATQPSPVNEPGISNTRGTIAMAKRGGDPNSATSEFFFNLANNNDPEDSMSLDNQNGGFTAFGRVSTPGMQVVDAIAALPRANYVINLDGFGETFKDWPMDAETAPPLIDQSKLVLIHSVTSVPAIHYDITGNTAPGVAGAMIDGDGLDISGFTPGESTLTVTATDLDGGTTSQSFDVLVTQNFSQWASGRSFPGGLSAPGDDGDRDGLCNLEEFAFLADPAHPDGAAGRPTISVGEGGGAPRAAITFKLRKFTASLSYQVEVSTDMRSWTPIWDSDDGLSLPDVEAVDHGDHYLVTVRAPEPAPDEMRLFLRVAISAAGP